MTQLDLAQNSLWQLFLKVHTHLVERVEQNFRQAELPPFEWYDVLVALKQAPNRRLRLSELADALLVNRTNVTRLVDRLEKAGLLYREMCPSDRRGTYAVLTEAGLAMQQQMWSVYSKGIAEYFGCHLNDEELQVMQQVLERMLAGVCNRSASPLG